MSPVVSAEFPLVSIYPSPKAADPSPTRYRPWLIKIADDYELVWDGESLYGAEFAEPLEAPPSSGFMVDGSEVAVLEGSRIN